MFFTGLLGHHTDCFTCLHDRQKCMISAWLQVLDNFLSRIPPIPKLPPSSNGLFLYTYTHTQMHMHIATLIPKQKHTHHLLTTYKCILK